MHLGTQKLVFVLNSVLSPGVVTKANKNSRHFSLTPDSFEYTRIKVFMLYPMISPVVVYGMQ